MTALFNNRSLEDHTNSLAHYLPNGKIFDAKFTNKTNLRLFLTALASELNRYQTVLEDAASEYDLETTQNLITEWENALGIPNSCFGHRYYSIEDRRKHLLMVLNDLHGNTAQDYINVAAKLGYTITVESPKAHAMFPMKFPLYLFESGKAVKNTLIIHLPPSSAVKTFPLKFPIKLQSPDNQLLRCLFSHMKPAHVNLIYVFDLIDPSTIVPVPDALLLEDSSELLLEDGSSLLLLDK